MGDYPPTVIIRHRRENLKKCSLTGLESRADCRFYTYPHTKLPPLEGYLVLSIDGPELSLNDCQQGLVLLDGTWRYAARMEANLSAIAPLERRRLPTQWRTAYPRRQEDCDDPSRGLASIEALFAAYVTLGRSLVRLLDHYHWREQFLTINELSLL